MGGFFLAAERCSRRLQRWGPLGPVLCFLVRKKFQLKKKILVEKKIMAKKNYGEQIISDSWQLAGGS